MTEKPKFFSPHYTQIPNDLLDTWMKELSESELKVLLAVFRYTVGFHRRRWPLSSRYLEKKTGLSARACRPAGLSLADKGYVTLSPGGPNKPAIYSIPWRDETPHVGVLGEETTSSPKEHDGADVRKPLPRGEETTSSGVRKPLPQIKESIKDNNKNKESTGRTPGPQNGKLSTWTQAVDIASRENLIPRVIIDTYLRSSWIIEQDGGSFRVGCHNDFSKQVLEKSAKDPMLSILEGLVEADSYSLEFEEAQNDN